MEFSLPQSETTQQRVSLALTVLRHSQLGWIPGYTQLQEKPEESIPAAVWENHCVLWVLHTAWHTHRMAFSDYAEEGKKGLKPAEWDVAFF